MVVKILVFGKLADITGGKELEVGEVKDVTALRRLLENDFKEMNGLKYIVAVNKKVVTEGFPISAGDEVALLPPFSGG